METIRAGMRASSDSDSDVTDFSKPPLSDPADLNPNRRTQDWKFPSMAPPASADPEVSRFLFREERPDAASDLSGRPPLVHHPTDPLGLLPEPYDLMPPKPQDNRASVGSLIDLDEGLAMPELTRPSTANSDAVSVAGSDIGGANPFDLERHASLYQPAPLTAREPSIYVSDDSDFARLATSGAEDNNSVQAAVPDSVTPPNDHNLSGRGTAMHSRTSSYDDESYSANEHDSPEYLTMVRIGGGGGGGRGRTRAQSSASSTQHQQQQHRQHHTRPASAMDDGIGTGILDSNATPAAPAPPSARVMQGMASREQVRDEVMRLLACFSEQLGATNSYVSALPVRTGRRGSEAYAG
ncbi:hypothetical protein VTK56DRAFT_3435 [Thermocarpiscus australiensis]